MAHHKIADQGAYSSMHSQIRVLLQSFCYAHLPLNGMFTSHLKRYLGPKHSMLNPIFTEYMGEIPLYPCKVGCSH